MLNFIQKADQFFARPFKPALLVITLLNIPGLVVMLVGRFVPHIVSSTLVFAAIALLFLFIVRCVPYLIATLFVFYSWSRLPVADRWTSRMTVQLICSVVVLAFLLWRTWRNWPKVDERMRPLPPGAKPAPWWGWLLGFIRCGSDTPKLASAWSAERDVVWIA